ncbi:dolichyl pyrophosphate Glc1Man9GlcNAc2 alpha-1,3-glucosyltransferase-like [Varroa jacobsoni]|uniref:Alpha-1,3-glucosyltransferase n=1 Tax=Varroa destructor TaxID=109461 RepID=A0A7M7JHK2_VARDE|nr:dolichyl pyrophosphate Glc1Man9GlcNAc2 alpha-1,3-glucosyltransferase-like [Varroa destructor]XP_022696917.1 dolichyl pyrophosphate Glc1Man9GlcNAc2 alpha-1,3-glucosyltransferase-like [Varroa jacobsoni]
MWNSKRDVLTIVGLATCIKVLLVWTYRSTDFEVHRNWLAITYSRPINEWYIEDSSQWTLDYPPLFAWLEWLLSQVAVLVDPEIVKIENENYASDRCVIFQRFSVICTDIVLIYAAVVWHGILYPQTRGLPILFQPLVLVGLILNPGLLIVDHIHFQYNGILTGIMLLAIARTYQGSVWWGALWFSILLNMKHIYAYIAPPFFVYLLSSYVLAKPFSVSRIAYRLAHLGTVVLTVFTVSFLPFMLHGQLKSILSRLFPLKRGLVHAYWAPNTWALYAGADKLLEIIATRTGHQVARSSLTSGLVGDAQFAVLPDVPPALTIVAAILLMLPSLIPLFRRPNPTKFIQSVVHCGLVSFLVGFHVHEKGILIPLLSLLPLAIINRSLAGVYVLLSAVGHFCLFPLIITREETFIKAVLAAFYGIYITYALGCVHRYQHLSRWGQLYLFGLVPLFIYTELLGHVLTPQLPFLPLMATSVYCTFGVHACFLRILVVTFDEIKEARHNFRSNSLKLGDGQIDETLDIPLDADNRKTR